MADEATERCVVAETKHDLVSYGQSRDYGHDLHRFSKPMGENERLVLQSK
jgi:hypothetical protein